MFLMFHAWGAEENYVLLLRDVWTSPRKLGTEVREEWGVEMMILALGMLGFRWWK